MKQMDESGFKITQVIHDLRRKIGTQHTIKI